MPENRRQPTTTFKNPKTVVRDASYNDLTTIRINITICATKFFGSQDLELEFRSSIYSLATEQTTGKISAYANFGNAPNINALPTECWLDWMHFHYGLKSVTYGNALFLTFLVIEDPYNTDVLHNVFEEVFLREPKVKFICTIAPPIDSIYKAILGSHCKQIFPIKNPMSSISSPSIFVCEKYEIIPRMRLRRALTEDNDDLVRIIDENFQCIQLEWGDFYIAEQVLRNDPSETMIVAEIDNTTVGMIWTNANINRKELADNFEIAVYGNFLKSQLEPNDTELRNVIDVVRKKSEEFFNIPTAKKITEGKSPSEEKRMSLNNLYISSNSDDSSSTSLESKIDDNFPKRVFKMWQHIEKSFRSTETYTKRVQKTISIPKSTEVTNAFAIKLFGVCSSIDPRRVFDLVAAAFTEHSEKDYCIISMSTAEASSDSSSGPLLKYFSRVIPRPGCKLSDCVYVAHRNSFFAEIEVQHLTNRDVKDVENMLYCAKFREEGIYHVADIMLAIEEYLTKPSSLYDILTIRCRDCAIGFVVIEQSCSMSEFQSNYVLYEDDDLFPDWKSGQLRYLHLNPVFTSEWVHVTREILRLTGYFSMFFKLKRELNKPILNSILLHMYPILPRKRLHGTSIEPYALYYLNIKICHLARFQDESRVVIVGFNETCKGFLRTLLFSPKAKHIHCLNITVVTECPGLIEAEYDHKAFEKHRSIFFEADNQFTADYMRKLEFRTWVRFIEGELKGINSDEKRIALQNGTALHYDRLFLMCSSRFGPPKSLKTIPSNYLEVNSRLDKIIFYKKIQLLALEFSEYDLPILIYGSVVMTHSCLSTLVDLGIKPSLICLVEQKIDGDDVDFPDFFDDEHIKNWLFAKEHSAAAGVRIYHNMRFVDWNLDAREDAIESVVFQSETSSIDLKCLAFISFHRDASPEHLQQSLASIKFLNNRIAIDEYSCTNIPSVYACGNLTQYHDTLRAKQVEQRYFNQIEVGKQLAMSFIEGRLTGIESSMVKAHYVKPIFRQSQLIDGWLYGGVRKPGRYVPRQSRKDTSGEVLITSDENGEYCRLVLDQSGFISEISCITLKYKNLEILNRIYGLHENIFYNLKERCGRGEIANFMDFFYEGAYSAILHDQFLLLRETIRRKNLLCLKDFLGESRKIDKNEIEVYLKSKGMHQMIESSVMEFIKKHWKSLHPHYALPDDFLR